MKTKQEIVENWLPRYTQMPLEGFGTYILLTNFNNYVDIFCENFGIEKPNYSSNMRCATADGITIINFGMGSPNAAIIMDLLSAIKPKACLFLGKCGGISWMSSSSAVALSWTPCNQSGCPLGQPSLRLSPSAAYTAILGTPEDGETEDHDWAAP